MKSLLKTLLSTTLLLIHLMVSAQNTDIISYNPNAKIDTAKKSIPSRVIGIVHGDSIKINYYSPGVRNRVIWGGLVPYDRVWVTGAHHATNVEIRKPFMVGGKEISAGKYALFSVPGKKKWIIIINKHWQQHLTDEYNEKDDVVRWSVKPKKNKHTERLQYFIESINNNKARITMAWEKVRIEFPVFIKN